MTSFLLSHALLGCVPQHTVVRKRGDVTHAGRRIPANAYAYYVTAFSDEQRGHVDRASDLYALTLRYDPASGAAWAGLLRTECDPTLDHAKRILRAAETNADRPALALVAFARCALRGEDAGHPSSTKRALLASDASRRALVYEPLLAEATSTLGRALEAQGQQVEARRVVAAYELYAGHALTKVGQAEHERRHAFDELDRTILSGPRERAMDAAAGWLSLGELSVRMLALGKADQARLTATEVLENDPDQPDAQLVSWMAEAPPLWTLPTDGLEGLCPLGQVLFTLQLARSDPKAARRLSRSLALYDEDDDDLLDWWLAELKRRID